MKFEGEVDRGNPGESGEPGGPPEIEGSCGLKVLEDGAARRGGILECPFRPHKGKE